MPPLMPPIPMPGWRCCAAAVVAAASIRTAARPIRPIAFILLISWRYQGCCCLPSSTVCPPQTLGRAPHLRGFTGVRDSLLCNERLLPRRLPRQEEESDTEDRVHREQLYPFHPMRVAVAGDLRDDSYASDDQNRLATDYGNAVFWLRRRRSTKRSTAYGPSCPDPPRLRPRPARTLPNRTPPLSWWTVAAG